MKKVFISALLIFGFLILAYPSDSNAQSCATPPTDTGRVSMSVTVQGGTYRVWSRIKAADSTNNSFYVQIGENNCAELVGDAPITADRWTWVDYLDGSTTNKYEVTLPAGTHAVTLIGNEDGVGVDKLLMTTDLNCVPEGISGDNCIAETPDNDAPVISNPRVTDVTDTSVNIRWELDEYASGVTELRELGSNSWQPGKNQSCCEYNLHVQSINDLKNNTIYEYRITSEDASGNSSTSQICRFTTGGAAEQACDSTPPTSTSTPTPTVTPTPTDIPTNGAPPIISNPRTEEVTATTAKFKWELNKPASGQVEYRPTGSNTWQKTGLQVCTPTDCRYDNHIQSVSGLSDGTTYEYRITSADVAGNETTTDICYFTAGGSTSQSCEDSKPTGTTPSPTTEPNTTTLNFQIVKLHGIGNGGDNTNPNAAGNPDPNRKTRDIAIELFDSNGNLLPTINSSITFANNGIYSGTATLPDNVSSGNYIIKLKSPQFLKKQVSGIINIEKGSETNIPTVSLSTGDIDDDNSLSIFDYNILVDCYSDLLPAKNCSDENKKLMADISDDGNVNASDYNLFLRELSVASGD